MLIKQVMELAIGNQPFTWLTAVVLSFLVLVIVLGAVGLYHQICRKKQKCLSVLVVSKNNITDRHFLGYFSLFVLFAVTFDMSRLSMFLVFLVILVMIGVVYVKNKLFYINPCLNILGFNFYEIEYEIEGDKHSGYIFYKGDFKTNKTYDIKVKDENFAFVDKGKK